MAAPRVECTLRCARYPSGAADRRQRRTDQSEGKRDSGSAERGMQAELRALKLGTPSLRAWEQDGGPLRVYEPAQDTFLLLDALQQDAARLHAQAPAVCLEVGTGSGCVITFLGQLCQAIQTRDPTFSLPQLVATDINEHAVSIAQKTATENGVPALRAVCTDLVDALLPELEHRVDVLLFNPPYGPTDEQEFVHAQRTLSALLHRRTGANQEEQPAEREQEDEEEASREAKRKETEKQRAEAGRDTLTRTDDVLLSAAWAGGPNGRVLLDRFLPFVDRLLSDTGVFYLLCVRENRPDQISEFMRTQYQLESERIVERKAFNERLSVTRFQRSSIVHHH